MGGDSKILQNSILYFCNEVSVIVVMLLVST